MSQVERDGFEKRYLRGVPESPLGRDEIDRNTKHLLETFYRKFRDSAKLKPWKMHEFSTTEGAIRLIFSENHIQAWEYSSEGSRRVSIRSKRSRFHPYGIVYKERGPDKKNKRTFKDTSHTYLQSLAMLVEFWDMVPKEEETSLPHEGTSHPLTSNESNLSAESI